MSASINKTIFLNECLFQETEFLTVSVEKTIKQTKVQLPENLKNRLETFNTIAKTLIEGSSDLQVLHNEYDEACSIDIEIPKDARIKFNDGKSMFYFKTQLKGELHNFKSKTLKEPLIKNYCFPVSNIIIDLIKEEGAIPNLDRLTGDQKAAFEIESKANRDAQHLYKAVVNGKNSEQILQQYAEPKTTTPTDESLELDSPNKTFSTRLWEAVCCCFAK